MNIELTYLRQIFDSIYYEGGTMELGFENGLDIAAEVFRFKQHIHAHTPDKYFDSKTYLNIQVCSVNRLVLEIEEALNYKTYSEKKTIILNEMLTSLQELIEYLWKYYPVDFNRSTITSRLGIERHLECHRLEISESLSIIDSLNVSLPLKEIMQSAIVLKLPEDVTYNSLYFGGEVIKYLRLQIPGDLTEKNLVNLLISLQFNHPTFYELCKSQITERLTTLPVMSDHFRELVFIRKTLIQNIPLNIPLYTPLYEPIQDMLLKLIDSELEFLKELDFINTELVNSGLLDSSYKVSFSVKQLAFYIYLNVEAGIITEQKATRVHQYIRSHVSTAEKDEISEKSFSNGYYVHSPEDIRKVSDKLARMLAIAQDKY